MGDHLGSPGVVVFLSSAFQIVYWLEFGQNGSKLDKKTTLCLQPYQDENTGSRPISEVNHLRAWVVLGWVTTWEVQVL